MDVLVVEDDFIIQMFIEKVVGDLGWNLIATASNSDQALASLKNSIPDLVMMDIGIEGEKDGIMTAMELMEHASSLRVVFVTGNADKATMDRASKVNPLGYIFKPIDEERLKGELLGFYNEMKF